MDINERSINLHSKSNDQRAQREPVHRDAEQVHSAECEQHGQQQYFTDHLLRFSTHEDKLCQDHDGDCSDNVDDEGLNRRINAFSLLVNLVKLNA